MQHQRTILRQDRQFDLPFVNYKCWHHSQQKWQISFAV